jgi:RNA polymerase sigma-70 factor, ECF subfamily
MNRERPLHKAEPCTLTASRLDNMPAETTTERPQVADLVRTYSPFVWRMLRSLGVREADLDDMSQEAFLVVHRKLPTFEGRGPLRSWIYGIALRVASDYRAKAHHRREVHPASMPLQSVPPDQEAAIRRQQAMQLMDRLLESLSDEQRPVFVLYEVEELSMREVSEIVGCPLQTAYSRYNAARGRIHAYLERHPQEKSSP